MEPLNKREIELCERELCEEFVVLKEPERWQRLFFTARLGAEFIKQTQKQVPL